MSEHVLETVSNEETHPSTKRRQHPVETLILSELPPDSVVDHLDDDCMPKTLITFGQVREICPKCNSAHLRLVLRQQCVRLAHLFCAECHSCFDAHYADGHPALTI
jgi:hypothetical protein